MQAKNSLTVPSSRPSDARSSRQAGARNARLPLDTKASTRSTSGAYRQRSDVDLLKSVDAIRADIVDGNDAIPQATELLAALYAEAGEWPASVNLDVEGYVASEDISLPVCTCPLELVARGGWQSSCPEHGI